MGFIFRTLGDENSVAQRLLQDAVDDGRLVRQCVDFGDSVKINEFVSVYYRQEYEAEGLAYIAALERFINGGRKEEDLDAGNRIRMQTFRSTEKIDARHVAARLFRRLGYNSVTQSCIFEKSVENILSGKIGIEEFPLCELSLASQDKLKRAVKSGALGCYDLHIVEAKKVDLYARLDMAHQLPEMEAQLRAHLAPSVVFYALNQTLENAGIKPLGNLLGYTSNDVAFFERRSYTSGWQRRILACFQGSFRRARIAKMKREGVSYDPGG